MVQLFYVATVLSMGNPTSFEVANQKLFENWATKLHIPSITIGVPTEEELEESIVLLDDIYAELIAATSDDLPTSQRELEVPFAMGMIEGVRAMLGDQDAANSCLKHLSHLDDAVSGLSASRMWRMRLHAYNSLNMEEKARECAAKLLKIKNADIEDKLAGVLYEFKNDSYGHWDRQLVSLNRGDLRWAFACSVASNNPPESLFAVFTLAEDLVQLGADPILLDNRMYSLLQRLDPPVTIVEDHPNKLVSMLASRLLVQRSLDQQRYESALPRLTKLVERGCVFSAQQLLTTLAIVPSQVETSAALDLVLQYPEKTSYQLAYWQLFSGAHAVRIGDKAKAVQMLQRVAQESNYFSDAQKMLRFLEGADVEAMKQEIEVAAMNGKSIERIIAKIHAPEIATQLLQQYIGLWHDEGIARTPWLRGVISKLIVAADNSSPLMLGEAHRLLGKYEEAALFFRRDIASNGENLQTAIGLAHCERDGVAIRRAIKGLASNGENKYWFWHANALLVQWYCEDGGDQMKAKAKVNRLSRLDPNLGGEQFAALFQAAVD